MRTIVLKREFWALVPVLDVFWSAAIDPSSNLTYDAGFA